MSDLLSVTSKATQWAACPAAGTLAAIALSVVADNNTKIVPGHGPLGNKADLTRSRDMLIAARDRVQKLFVALICTRPVV